MLYLLENQNPLKSYLTLSYILAPYRVKHT